MSDLVSIVVPLYNRARIVSETIESVLSQTTNKWELLIVDDHSVDRSVSVAKNYANSYENIRVWQRRSPRRGAPSCRNEGMRDASGNYIMFLDSDDLLSPECIANRLARKSLEPIDFLVFGASIFNVTPGDNHKKWISNADDYLTDFLRAPSWQTMCVLWNADYIRSLGGWDERLPSWQDWELHVRALSTQPKFEVFTSQIDCYVRRGAAERISQSSETDPRHLTARVAMLTDVCRNLRDSNQLTRQRRVLLAEQFLRVAITAKTQGNSDLACTSIDAIQTERLLPRRRNGDITRYVSWQCKLRSRNDVAHRFTRLALRTFFVR